MPLAASILRLAPVSHNINGLIGDWHGLVCYGALQVYVAFLFGSPDLLAALEQQRFVSLVPGVAAYATLSAVFVGGAVRSVFPPTCVRAMRSCRRSTPRPGCSRSWALPTAISPGAPPSSPRRRKPSVHSTCCTGP